MALNKNQMDELLNNSFIAFVGGAILTIILYVKDFPAKLIILLALGLIIGLLSWTVKRWYVALGVGLNIFVGFIPGCFYYWVFNQIFKIINLI